MTVSRSCRRKFGLKKLFLLAIVCCLTFYIASVIHRAKGLKTIWNVTGKPNLTESSCGAQCGPGLLPFYVKTGTGTKQGPTICFKNQILISDEKKNFDRGINLVVVNDQTLEVEYIKTYDTYVDDYDFLRDMKTKVKEGYLVIAVSFDEISENLSEEGYRFLKLFGSEKIEQVNFRDSYLFIGQKGLKQGHAVEFIQSRDDKQFADPIEKMGCFSLPMGPIYPVQEALYNLVTINKVEVGGPLLNCGMEKPCADQHFSVSVSTGKGSDELPQICVSGNIIMSKDVNNAGRGINVVVVDYHTSQPKAVSRFDTYEKDSLNMELFLESLHSDDLIIAVAHDDASRKMSFHAREVLNQLGSSMAQNIKFRDVWYFVGQKGIDGFTNMEKISYAGMEAEWPKPISEAFCVPNKIQGSKIIPDPPVNRNDGRREFCKKYDGYGEFCDPSKVDDPAIKPAKLIEDDLKAKPVYSTPILIVPGLNHNALVRTMETTVMQQGVQLDNILVAWDDKYPELAELATLFGFRNVSLDSSLLYTDQMMKAIEKGAQLFPEAKYMIVLEEDLVLSPDFLYFLAQCESTLDKDPSLLGISAFNFNGYEKTSSNLSLVYRVQDFPGLAFILKMSVYRQRMKGSMKMCCHNRTWYDWTLSDSDSQRSHMLVPDVSRVYRYPYEGFAPDENYLVGLFNTHRETSLESKPVLVGLNDLTEPRYDGLIKDYISSAFYLENLDFKQCSSENNLLHLPDSKKNFVGFYTQSKDKDYTVLWRIGRCFNLFIPEGHNPKNMYKGVLRFTFMQHNVMLIGSKSVFAHLRPSETSEIDTR